MRLEEIFIRETISTYFTCSPNKILGIYQYGSRLYGTNDESSDWDFIVVVDGLVGDESYKQYETEEFDIHLMTIEHYKTLLLQHDIMSLEMYYQKEPIMKCPVEFELNLPALRKSISSVVNNSWVKFKKKLTLDAEDNYVGIKSCFHALRIVELGRKIATNSTNILETDVSLWGRIKKDAMDCEYNWENIHKLYKPLFNEYMTEFRLVAPKL